MSVNKVSFAVMTAAEYAAITTKSGNTLYFISDQRRIYKGTVPYSNPVHVVSQLPDVSEAQEGDLYVKTPEFELSIFVEGSFRPIAGGGSGTAGLTAQNGGQELGTFNVLNFNHDLFDLTYDENGTLTVGSGLKTEKLNSSRFNTNSGTTSPTVSLTTTMQNRIVAQPVGSAYHVGDWVTTGTLRQTFNSGTIQFNCPNPFWIPNSGTKFKFEVIQSGTIFTYTTAAITGNGTYGSSSDKAEVAISGFDDDLIGSKASASFKLYIASIIPAGGRFSVKISHIINGVSYPCSFGDYFYDANPAAPAIGSASSSVVATAGQKKWLSGVEYCTTGASVATSITSISNQFNQTCPAVALVINLSNFGLSSYNVAPNDLIGFSSTVQSNTEASYNHSAAITGNVFRTGQATATVTPKDWSDGAVKTTDAVTVAIDTRASSSSDILEDFKSETYRKTLLLGSWDSTAALQTGNLKISGTNGSSSGLLSLGGSDSSGKYIRAFKKANVVKTNGIVTFAGTGLTEAALTAGTFKFEVSLNGSDWFDLALPFSGIISGNGSGCRVNSDVSKLSGSSGSLAFTLGSFATSASSGDGGWGMWVRVTLSTGMQLTSMSINW